MIFMIQLISSSLRAVPNFGLLDLTLESRTTSMLLVTENIFLALVESKS